MKKLFLLLSASSIGLSSWAQQNVNALMSPTFGLEKLTAHYELASPLEMPKHVKRNVSTSRTTTPVSVNHSNWFSYWDQNSTSTSTYYYNNSASDTNIFDNTGTTAYHINIMGIGMSFDPTDMKYYGSTTNTVDPILGGPITNAIPYKVDSFYVPFRYFRNNNSDTLADSLVIELLMTVNSTAVDSGTYKLSYPKSATYAFFTPDSVARFADARYSRNSVFGNNEVWDSIKAPKQRYTFALRLGDTAGVRAANFGLSTIMNVPAGGKVISYVHFKSMHATTLGTSAGGSTVANSNYIRLYAGNTEGGTDWPQQTPHSVGYPGSYQTGLVGWKSLRYSDTAYTFSGHNILLPAFLFSGPGLTVPNQAFHLTYTVIEDGVANINSTISKVSAYPNPTSNTLNVAFDLSDNNNVTVTLSNMVGQVVATETVNNALNGKAVFNTSNLPAGVYLYTVHANGEHTTGRVSVTH